MIKRTSKTHIDKILEENNKWKILDLGCGYRAHKNASVIADSQDFSKFYKERKFIQIKEKILPFKDLQILLSLQLPNQLFSIVREKLIECSDLIIGKKNFSTFCKLKSEVKNKICNVENSFWVFNQ